MTDVPKTSDDRWSHRPIQLVVVTALIVCAFDVRGTSAQEPNGHAAAAAIQDAFVKAIERAETSVVSIARERLTARRLPEMEPLDVFPPRPRGRQETPGITDPDFIPNEFGTGIIIDRDGLILTNYHVVRGGAIEGKSMPGEQTLYVRLSDRRGFAAKIHAADPRSDLAVLKIDADNLTPLEFGKVKEPKKGQLVLALGNPYAVARDGSPSATWGIISNISRSAAPEEAVRESDRKKTIHHLGTLLHLDMRLNLGTSGGPVLNLNGELIGITTSLAAVTGYEKSAGFAVPIDESMRRIIETLKEGKEVEFGFLGVSFPPSSREIGPDESQFINREFKQPRAVKIQEVMQNCPAAQSGMAHNDIILSVNDKPVLSRDDLMREVALIAPGNTARIAVWRPGETQERTLAVVVGKWPVHDDEGIIATKRRYEPWRGIIADFSTARNRLMPLEFNRAYVPKGVLITEVEPGSIAAAAELQAGDFISRVDSVEVSTPQRFYEAVRNLKGPVELTLVAGRTPRKVILKPQ